MMMVKINFTQNQSEKVQNFKKNLIINGGIEFFGAIFKNDCVTI